LLAGHVTNDTDDSDEFVYQTGLDASHVMEKKHRSREIDERFCIEDNDEENDEEDEDSKRITIVTEPLRPRPILKNTNHICSICNVEFECSQDESVMVMGSCGHAVHDNCAAKWSPDEPYPCCAGVMSSNGERETKTKTKTNKKKKNTIKVAGNAKADQEHIDDVSNLPPL